MDSKPTQQEAANILNLSFKKKRNPSVETLSGGLGGNIVDFNPELKTLTMVFKGTEEMCNGKPGISAQVQGGFAAAMLDAVTAQMVVVWSQLEKTVATLEQKTTFIAPVPPGVQLFATAKIIKFGRSIAFLEAKLREGAIDGKLLCTASTTCSLVQLPSRHVSKKAKL